MNFNFYEFEIIVRIERHQDEKYPMKKFGEELNLTKNQVKKIVDDLLIKELIISTGLDKYQLTLMGYEWLKPYRVKKAFILAAGIGRRMKPISLNTPKPLILVHGKRIIETLLDSLLENGIQDIYIVRGYLAEQFDILKKKYPMINFLENPIYDEANSISSVYLIRNMMENSYLLEANFLLYNKNIVRKYEYSSNYVAIKSNDLNNSYTINTDESSKIIKKKAQNFYEMFGFFYLSKKDAKQMSFDLAEAFHVPKGKEKEWTSIPLKDYKMHYQISKRLVENGDVIKLNTFEELKKIDQAYIG